MIPFLSVALVVRLLAAIPVLGSTFTLFPVNRPATPSCFLLQSLLSRTVSPQERRGRHLDSISTDNHKTAGFQLRAYTKHAEEPLHLDSVFVGEYSATWTIRDFRRKVIWRDRSSATPALTTSRFSLGGIRDFRLKLLPCGNLSSKERHLSVHLEQVEKWRELLYPITITVGGISRGPVRYRSPEYFQESPEYGAAEFPPLIIAITKTAK